jgi:hypothetical protein
VALEFRIDLSGNLSEKLGKSGEALHASGEHAKHAKHEFELFEGEVGKLSGEVGGLGINLAAIGKGGSLFTFDLAEGLKSAYEIVEKLVDKFLELGVEIVQTAGKVQDLDLAVKLNVGEERAKQIDELAESFERTTRFDAADMKRALLPLLKQGVGDRDTLDTVATIATDMAARNAGGIADVQQTIESFAGIFQRGRLKPAQLAQFGVQANDYFAALGQSLGVSAEAAAKMSKQGKVAQDKLAAVAVQLIAARQGGAIGGPSLESAKTLGATLARLGNVKENLFEKLANSPAMAKVQASLDHFIDAMRGDVGNKLVEGIGEAFNVIGGWLEWATSPAGIARLSGVIDDVTSSVKDMAQFFRENWGEIKEGAQGLLEVLKVVAKTVGMVVDGWAKLVNLNHDLNSGQVTRDIVDTLKGEHGGIATSNTPKNMTWDESIQGYRPNASVSIPKFAEGGIVTGPTLAIVGEAGPEAIVPLGDMAMSAPLPLSRGMAGGGASLTVGDITVQVVMPEGSNGADAGYAAAQTFRVEFKKMLDEIGWAYGATTLE